MAFNQTISLVGPSASASPGSAGSSSESISIPATGDYSISWDITQPLARDGAAASGLIVRIRNSTTAANVFLGTAGVCSGGQVWFSATAADVIVINLSSVTAADLTGLNIIQGVFAISSGV